jgi:deoxyribose-phosphate aldolase
MDVARFLDHSVLRPEAGITDVDEACAVALRLGLRGVVVAGAFVAHVRLRLAGSGVKVVAVAAFPHGNQTTDVKAHEAARAAALGADEIDYVISIPAALAGDSRALRDEAASIVAAVPGRVVKTILEVGHLTPAQRTDAARAVVAGGVHFVKTCTGFGPGGATPEDVRLLADAAAGRALVKASGGIRTRVQCLALIEAGAAALGTSRSAEICAEA